ncbi:hypothetical protein [Vagococcus acidifermentans]
MAKRSSKVHYCFKQEMVDVKTIFKLEKKRRGRSRYLLSVIVKAVYEVGKILPIKQVYVRNRDKRNEYLVLAPTNTTLTEADIIQLYGKRWSNRSLFQDGETVPSSCQLSRAIILTVSLRIASSL